MRSTRRIRTDRQIAAAEDQQAQVGRQDGEQVDEAEETHGVAQGAPPRTAAVRCIRR